MKPGKKIQKKANARQAEYERMVQSDRDRGRGFTRPGSRNPKKQA